MTSHEQRKYDTKDGSVNTVLTKIMLHFNVQSASLYFLNPISVMLGFSLTKPKDLPAELSDTGGMMDIFLGIVGINLVFFEDK